VIAACDLCASTKDMNVLISHDGRAHITADATSPS